MLTNYKEYAMTRGLLVETGTAPGVDINALVASLEGLADTLEAEIDKIFAVAQAQITGHVRVSMRNNQGTWNKLKNWWQTTWHGKDREKIESVGGVENLRLELSGLITLHEQQVLSELMDIMEAGPINQALAQMTPMLQNLQLQVKTRIRSAITSVAKKLQAQAAAQPAPQPPQPGQPQNTQQPVPQPGQPNQPQNTPPPSNGSGSAGGGSAGAPPLPGGGASHTAHTGSQFDPNFGSHSSSTGTSGGWSDDDYAQSGTYDPSFGAKPGSEKPVPGAGDPAQDNPLGPDSDKEPEDTVASPDHVDPDESDPDDLHAAMNRPGGIDGPGSGQGGSAETSAPPKEKKTRTRAPKLTLGPDAEPPAGEPQGQEDPAEDPADPVGPGTEEPDSEEPQAGKGPVVAPLQTSWKDRLKAMKQKINARTDDDDDDDYVPQPPPLADDEPETPDEDDGYERPESDMASSETSAAVASRGWQDKIKAAAEDVASNPGMTELANYYSSPQGGKGRTSVDRAKFYRFITQLTSQNPMAKKILSMPDLKDRYKEIANRVADPENMGRIANRLNPGNLYPASDNPDGFYGHLNSILRDQGVHDGVSAASKKAAKKAADPDKPKAPPKPRKKAEPKKMRAESIGELKSEYLRRLREVSASTVRSQAFLDLNHLSFGEQVRAYRKAMWQS
jgi:hypothetical protein